MKWLIPLLLALAISFAFAQENATPVDVQVDT
jgi:hypothetical protein